MIVPWVLQHVAKQHILRFLWASQSCKSKIKIKNICSWVHLILILLLAESPFMQVNLLKHSLFLLKLNFEGYHVMLLQQFELHNGLTIITAKTCPWYDQNWKSLKQTTTTQQKQHNTKNAKNAGLPGSCMVLVLY